MTSRPIFCALIAAVLSCACLPKPNVLPAQTECIDPPGSHTICTRKIAIFFDGTANDEVADTNVKKLHSLVALQPKDNIAAFYIEGVGAKGKVIGMGMGWGFGMRIRKAYDFLLSQYRPGDEIYLVGFSRGAYSARILAAMLYYVGIPNAAGLNLTQREQLVDKLYDAFKGPQEDRRTRVASSLQALALPGPVPVRVKALALWDTVDALGLPDYKEDINAHDADYGDQLCNVDKAFHAVSIDDDRARIFTPILLTRRHLVKDCVNLGDIASNEENAKAYIDKVVDEVWFSGAHADVGGGYGDSLLSGVSLNWMIAKLAPYSLLPANAAVREDPFGASHDPERGFLWSILYKKMTRNIRAYTTQEGAIYNNQRLKVHVSALARLERCDKPACSHKDHEFQWETHWFPKCFSKTDFGYSFTGASDPGCRVDIVK